MIVAKTNSSAGRSSSSGKAAREGMGTLGKLAVGGMVATFAMGIAGAAGSMFRRGN